MRKVYIAITLDKYELPLAVADSPKELAELMGTTRNVVSSSIAHNTGRYKRVDIDEVEDYERDSRTS